MTHSSISDKASELAMIEEVSDWRRELVDYLENGTLPPERKSTGRLKMKAGRFTMVNGTHYKRGFTLPLLKCIFSEEGNYVLREIHEGICKSHSSVWVLLAHKAVRAGFYWLDLSKDSMAMVRNCDKCQRFTNITSNPLRS